MDRMASIEMALKNEASEMKWYREQSERSTNPVVTKLFLTLADDEKEHMQRIKGLHERLIADSAWPEEMPIEVAGTNVKEVLGSLLGRVGAAADQNEDDITALERAADFEAKGSKFYAELAEACSNAQERRFFAFLSGIEREHMLSIKDSLFYLKDPEGWLEQQGGQGLDGG